MNDKQKILIALQLLLIIILLITISVIKYRTNTFEYDCREQYNASKYCPCKQLKSVVGSNQNISPFASFNYSRVTNNSKI